MGIFSSEPHPIEKLIKEATDETLTSEDWSKFIAVCDEINTKPGKIGPIAVQALRARLAIPNGNVQLYSLTLLNAVAQNCGPVLQREIASTATAQVLQRLGTSPATHRSVLVRLLDVLKSLVEEFAKDSTLSQIEQVYKRVSAAHPALAKQNATPSRASNVPNEPTRAQNAGSKPTVDEQEDEDLKRAIELSIQESQRPTPAAEIARAAHLPDQAPKTYVRGLYDFSASEAGELSFQTGDIIEVVDRVYKEWWKGFLNGNEGIFPVNYVEPYTPESEQGPAATSQAASQPMAATEMAASGPSDTTGQSTSHSGQLGTNPAMMDESYLFAQVPAVEKLLTILASASQDGSGSSVIGNADVQRLYHQISSMRPRLVQLIDEYSMKKEELVEMNQKLMSARRAYEKLVSEAASGHHRQNPAFSSVPAPHPMQPQYSGHYQVPNHALPEQAYASQASLGHQSTGNQSIGQQTIVQEPLVRHPTGQDPVAQQLSQQPTTQHQTPSQAPPQPAQYQSPQTPQTQAQPMTPQTSYLPPQGTPHSHQAQNYASSYQPQAYQPQSYQPQGQPQQAFQPQTFLPQSHGTTPYQPQEYHLPPAGQSQPQKLPYPDDRPAVASPYANGVVTPGAPRPY